MHGARGIRKCFRSALGMEPPERRTEAAAAPTAEEAVPDAGRDPQTAPLVEPEPEPAANRGEVRVDVTEQRPEDGAPPQQGAQAVTILITLKEFITGNAFQVSIDPDADIAALKRLIHEEHGGAEPDGQRLLLNDSPVEDETERLRGLGIVDGTELRLGAQDAAEGRARREAREAAREAERQRQEQAKRVRVMVRVSAKCVLCISLMVAGGAVQQVGVWTTSPFEDDYRPETALVVGGAALLLVGALVFPGFLRQESGARFTWL
eukprot:COSAG04_NODE_500_length_13366_cov_33.972488_8_plen_264_part_00